MHGATRLLRRVGGSVVALTLAACAASPSSPSSSASAPPTPGPSTVATDLPSSPTLGPTVAPLAAVTVAEVASGLRDPIGITNAGDGSGRLFVNERGGRIRVVSAGGELLGTDFGDLSSRVGAGGERGLLGVAFHPDFVRNGRLFVHYSRKGDGATVISELSASSDRTSADPASERIIFTLAQPFSNHNGGEIAFGPDGYLYIGLGDGGSGGDPFGNAQNRQVLLGKILRIDVDAPPAGGKQYAIPDTNPYAIGGIAPGAGLPELWAYGLRNPWRFSFDRVTGDLYIGDVGQNAFEEIDRQLAGSRGGENYGWNVFEATQCYGYCGTVTQVAPVAEYSHGEGCSVTGGYVYRGELQQPMGGTYLFSDFCSGTIWTLPADGTLVPRMLANTGLQVTSFGEGEDGEIYLVDLSGGRLYHVVAN